jgi:glycosyltransferase involved in cell wall biosynthesis
VKRIKIGFNARVLKSPDMRGWTRYTVNLLEQLRKLPVELFLYHKEALNPQLCARLAADNVHFIQSPPSSYFFWEQVWFAQRCAQDKVDLVHCPIHFGLPYLPACPKVLTLHDAIVGSDSGIASWVPRIYQAIARKSADRIISVSEFSKAQLASEFNISREKISVVSEGAEAIFSQPASPSMLQTARDELNLKRPFLFYAGGWDTRKNLIFLIECFRELGGGQADLLLVGGNPAEILQIRSIFPEMKSLVLAGKVSDRTLSCLYHSARGFVYPSLLEGFGLQVVEAFSAGCPVIGSSTSSLGEVIANSAATFHPTNKSECMGRMRQLIEDDAYRQSLIEHGAREIKKHSWERAAQETFEIYASLLSR